MKKVLLVFGTRLEAVKASTVKLVRTNLTIIVNEVNKLLKHISLAKACHKIINIIKENYAK